MPKVSVIVPVYNTEKYLRTCLDALVHQTLEDMEIILVNDGSTDSSKEILEEYAKKDARIRLIHKKNGGQGSARNLGIQFAKGEYIGFADSDDKVKEQLFETLYQKAMETSADMVECKFTFVQEDEKGIKELPARGSVREYKDAKDMFIDPQVSPWNKLYRREVIQNKVTFPEGLIYEDTSFYLKAIPYIKKSAHVDQALVYYYLHQDSTINRNKNQKVGDMLQVLEDALSFYKQKGFDKTYQQELEYFTSKILLCSHLGRIGRIKDAGLKKELYKRSFALLHKECPNYRHNPYLHGKIGLYMKLVRRWNCALFGKIIGKVLKG